MSYQLIRHSVCGSRLGMYHLRSRGWWKRSYPVPIIAHEENKQPKGNLRVKGLSPYRIPLDSNMVCANLLGWWPAADVGENLV
jgi:hypothetical protein